MAPNHQLMVAATEEPLEDPRGLEDLEVQEHQEGQEPMSFINPRVPNSG